MLNNLSVDDRQFGKKIGKHAQDFGLNASNERDRNKMIDIINDIVDNHDEVRCGTFRNQIGEVDFYIKGNDVVLANRGVFITILKNGIKNPRVMESVRRG